MAAHGKYLEVTSSATPGATTGETTTATLTVPAGVSWIFDYLRIESTSTTANIQLKAAGNNIWERKTASAGEDIDLATRYPRALQVDETETIEAELTTTTTEAVTVTLKVWIIEG